jgi:hypothetical protein
MTQPLLALVNRAAAFWAKSLNGLEERDDALVLALWRHLDQWAVSSQFADDGADDVHRPLAAEVAEWYGKWVGVNTAMDKHNWQNVPEKRQDELDSIGRSLHDRLCDCDLTSIEAFYVTAMLVFHLARAMQQTVPPALTMKRMSDFILNECIFRT